MRLATVVLLREQTWVYVLRSCTEIQGANDDEDRLILLLPDFLPFPWSISSYLRKVNFMCSISIFFSPTISWQWILTGCCCLMFIQIVLSLEHRIKAVSCLHFPAMRERRVMVVSLFMSRIEDLSSVFSCNAHRLWKLLTFLLETELPTKLFLKMVPLGKEFTFSVGKHLKYSIQAPPLPDQLHLHISDTTNALLKLQLQSIVTLLVFFPVKPFIYH